MHSEWFSVTPEAADLINSARSAGGRVIAVGTTAVRVIESAQAQRRLEPGQGWTDIFIYPPYEFKGVDSLVTNFHLPRTTLLALVYTFAGIDLARKAYKHAITEGYRFYSYGDAMLIV
jgi:S-adenosylmethionine:tRNA ribosyltransferase-isomerase